MNNKLDKMRRRLLSFVPVAILAPVRTLLAEISWQGTPRVMQGPMLGWVDEHTLNIWVRTSGSVDVQAEYWSEADPTTSRKTTAIVTASKATDYTTVLNVGELNPDTSYRYRILIEGKVDEYMRRHGDMAARTAPRRSAGETVSIAFGSCARVQQKPIQPVWNAVDDKNPDLFLWLGDNIYADSIDPAIMAEVYRHQRNVPSFRPVMQSIPQLAIWDDHDYGLNDHDRRNPAKDQALRVFKNYWANPSYGIDEADGVFFNYCYGRLEIFMLDDRFYRDPIETPNGPEKTMLGVEQKAWLKKKLLASTASFKILAIGNVWTDEKGEPSESWASFKDEREELFEFIKDNDISGIILLSGDNHVAELNCIPRSEDGSYDLYEFSGSPLAQDPSQSWLNYRPTLRMRQVYFRSSNFGLMEFDFRGDDPSVTFTLRDEQGSSVWEPFTIRASQLMGKQSTWKDLIDARSMVRWTRAQESGHYYDQVNHD